MSDHSTKGYTSDANGNLAKDESVIEFLGMIQFVRSQMRSDQMAELLHRLQTMENVGSFSSEAISRSPELSKVTLITIPRGAAVEVRFPE